MLMVSESFELIVDETSRIELSALTEKFRARLTGSTQTGVVYEKMAASAMSPSESIVLTTLSDETTAPTNSGACVGLFLTSN